MEIKYVFNGVGAVVVGVILGFILNKYLNHSDEIEPTFCLNSALEKYDSTDHLKEELLDKGKRKVITDNFSSEINSLSKANKVLKEKLINVSKRYVTYQPKFFNKKELSKVCVFLNIDKDKKNTIYANIFKKQWFDDSFYLNNSQKIEAYGLDKYIDKRVLSEQVKSVREKYRELSKKIVDKDIENFISFDYKIIKEDQRHKVKYTGYIYPSLLLALHEPELKKIDENLDISYINEIGVDKKNNFAYFDYIYLSDDYSWKYESVDEIEKILDDGEEIVIDLKLDLQSSNLKNHVSSRFSDIIAVGSASCEGDNDKENKRADIRSKQMALWIKEIFPDVNKPNKTILSTLSLGQYASGCSSYYNSSQRKLIIIGVTKKSFGVNIKQALKNVLSRNNSPMNPEYYSKFDFSEKPNFDKNDLDGMKSSLKN